MCPFTRSFPRDPNRIGEFAFRFNRRDSRNPGSPLTVTPRAGVRRRAGDLPRPGRQTQIRHGAKQRAALVPPPANKRVTPDSLALRVQARPRLTRRCDHYGSEMDTPIPVTLQSMSTVTEANPGRLRARKR